MKNKKNNKNNSVSGFTLIELLAVIVIMGVLMMAAIPAITNAITRSRKSTFASNAKEIINSVRTTVSGGDAVRVKNGSGTALSGICQFPATTQEVKIELTKVSISYLLERGGNQSAFGQEYGVGDNDVVGAVYIVNRGATSGGGEFYQYSIFLKDSGGNGIANNSSGGAVLEDNVGRNYVQVGTLGSVAVPNNVSKTGNDLIICNITT